MKTIKSLVLLAALAFAGIAKADTYSASLAATHGNTGSVTTNSAYITTLTLANPTTNAVTVELFDSPATNTTFSIGAYTNYISYSTNIVSTVTGYNGLQTLYTNTVMYNVANAVGSQTANYKSITKITVPASTTFGPFPLNTVAARGILVTNNGTIGVTLNYQRLK